MFFDIRNWIPATSKNNKCVILNFLISVAIIIVDKPKLSTIMYLEKEFISKKSP